MTLVGVSKDSKDIYCVFYFQILYKFWQSVVRTALTNSHHICWTEVLCTSRLISWKPSRALSWPTRWTCELTTVLTSPTTSTASAARVVVSAMVPCYDVDSVWNSFIVRPSCSIFYLNFCWNTCKSLATCFQCFNTAGGALGRTFAWQHKPLQ